MSEKNKITELEAELFRIGYQIELLSLQRQDRMEKLRKLHQERVQKEAQKVKPEKD